MKTSELYKPVDRMCAYTPFQRTYHCPRDEYDGLFHLMPVTCIVCEGEEIIQATFVYHDAHCKQNKSGTTVADLIAAPWHPSEDTVRFDKIFGEYQWVFDPLAIHGIQNYTYRPTF